MTPFRWFLVGLIPTLVIAAALLILEYRAPAASLLAP